MKYGPRVKQVIDQMAVNSILGTAIGFTLVGWVTVFPEKDMKADPIISSAVMALAFASCGGAAVSIAHLRGGSNE